MTKEQLTEKFNHKGKYYRHKTTDYYIKDDKNGKCTIYLQESKAPKKDPIDWIRNIKYKPTKVKIEGVFIYVHEGFNEAFNELLEVLYPQVNVYKEIDIIGYSHGAGVAQRLYFYLKQVLPVVKVNPPVLFGCPMMFSFKNLKGYLHIKNLCKDFITVRVGNDIVSRLPGLLLGFGRVGKELRFKVDRKKQNPIQYFKSLFTDHGLYYTYFKG